MFKQDQIEGNVFEEYEAWIMQDQDVFIWLLSIIYESVLPRVLLCKHGIRFTCTSMLI